MEAFLHSPNAHSGITVACRAKDGVFPFIFIRLHYNSKLGFYMYKCTTPLTFPFFQLAIVITFGSFRAFAYPCEGGLLACQPVLGHGSLALGHSSLALGHSHLAVAPAPLALGHAHLGLGLGLGHHNLIKKVPVMLPPPLLVKLLPPAPLCPAKCEAPVCPLPCLTKK